jgi:F0F1-type ATP synthase assembly protein I
MRIRNTLAALTAVAMLACASTAAVADDNTIVLYQGAQFNGRTNVSVNTATANVGDQVTAQVIPPFPSGYTIFQDATLIGTVTQVQRAGQGRRAQLGVEFNSLRLSDGRTLNLNASLTQSQQHNNGAQSGARVAIGALGGMLVGNAIGKTLFHTGGGGAVGFIGGGLLGANNQANFTVPAGSNMSVTLNQNLYVRRQSSQ